MLALAMTVARVVPGAIRAQYRMSRRSFEDLMPVLTMPLFALVFMAIFIHSGRRDLAGYALIAPLLMTIGQMGFFVASEVISNDRDDQVLELLVAAPTPILFTLWPRVLLLNALGLIGFAEAWAIGRFVFGAQVEFHHPWVVAATLIATVFASAGTAMVTAALFCFGRSTRTFQNSVTYPLYLLAGVLVPAAFLPAWVQPFSRLVFLYWAAELLRDTLDPAVIEHLWWRLGAIVGLGGLAGAIGGALLYRMLDRLRRDGTLGLL
jgi:ABC-2 type transport system permease protein